MEGVEMSNSSVFVAVDGRDHRPQGESPGRSYTMSLFQGGVAKIGDKIIEEANEVVEAGAEPADTRQQHVVHEAADLIYHLFVLLGHCDIPLD